MLWLEPARLWAAHNWRRTTKAASHNPSLSCPRCSGTSFLCTFRRCGVLLASCCGSGCYGRFLLISSFLQTYAPIEGMCVVKLKGRWSEVGSVARCWRSWYRRQHNQFASEAATQWHWCNVFKGRASTIVEVSARHWRADGHWKVSVARLKVRRTQK